MRGPAMRYGALVGWFVVLFHAHAGSARANHRHPVRNEDALRSNIRTTMSIDNAEPWIGHAVKWIGRTPDRSRPEGGVILIARTTNGPGHDTSKNATRTEGHGALPVGQDLSPSGPRPRNRGPPNAGVTQVVGTCCVPVHRAAGTPKGGPRSVKTTKTPDQQNGQDRKQTNTAMNIALNLNRLNATRLAEKCRHIEERLTGNSRFPDPNPSLATVRATREALELAAAAALDGGRTAVATRRARERELRLLLKQLAGHVASIALGNEEAILSSGYDVKRRGTPAGEPGLPTDLEARPSLIAGRVDLRWRPVRNAFVYHVHHSADGESWTLRAVSTKARARILDLPSATEAWFRVEAIGPAGAGPLSDVASCRVY